MISSGRRKTQNFGHAPTKSVSFNGERLSFFISYNGAMATLSDKPQSPRIINLSWGRMEVEGVGVGKDFKLWPGGGRVWDWRETDTHHVPGIQPADVKELLDNGSQTVVLSRGILQMLETCKETLDLLEENNIPVHIAETKDAVGIYNKLVSSQAAVGGLFHSTC